MPVLSVMCGLQASGKSSYVREHLPGHAVVSKDSMGRSSPKEPRMLSSVCDLLQEGRDVAVDNTNVDPESRIRLVHVGRAMGAQVYCYLFPPDVDACLSRNEGREGKKKVPVAAVLSFYERYVPPAWEEGYDRMFEVSLGPRGFATKEVTR